MRIRNILIICIILLSTGLVHYIQGDRMWDDEYIIYRYADNIVHGHGWSFNPTMTINGSTTTLYTLLVAAFGAMGLDIPSVGYVLSLFFLGVCGVMVFYLLDKNGFKIACYLSPLLVIIHPILTRCLGIETTLYLSLSLFSIYSYFQNRFTLTSALMALTVLTRPDGILLVIALFVHHLITHRKIPWNQLGIFILLLVPWMIYSQYTFGSFLPETLSAKMVQGEFTQFPLWQVRVPHAVIIPMPTTWLEPIVLQIITMWIFILILLYGLIQILRDKIKKGSPVHRYDFIGVLILWGTLHVIGYVLLNIPVGYRWHMAPIVLIYGILGGIGLEKLYFSFKKPWGLIFIGILFTVILIPEIKITQDYTLESQKTSPRVDFYYQAGEWLIENSPASASIGAGEVGVLGYYSDRTIIDRVGLVTPKTVFYRRFHDISWDIRYYRPEYYIQFDPPNSEADIPIDEEWWEKAYTPIHSVTFSNSTMKLIVYHKIDDSVIPNASDFRRALLYAVEKEDRKTIQFLLSQGGDINSSYKEGVTLVMRAAQKGNIQLTKLLLEKGADPNAETENHETALIDSAFHGRTEIVKLLLEHNANPNIKTKSGWTALLGAANQGKTEIVQLLLEHGADPNLQNADGNTALLTAAYEGYADIVKFLVEYKANPNIKNQNRGTALKAARWKGHLDIAQLLINAGAKE